MSVLRSSNFAAWNFHKYREEHFVASFRTLYDNKLIHVHAAARKVPRHPQYRNNLDVQSICEHNHFITLFQIIFWQKQQLYLRCKTSSKSQRLRKTDLSLSDFDCLMACLVVGWGR